MKNYHIAYAKVEKGIAGYSHTHILSFIFMNRETGGRPRSTHKIQIPIVGSKDDIVKYYRHENHSSDGESGLLSIIDTIMKICNDNIITRTFLNSNLDAINLELSKLVFKDMLELFKIKDMLTYEQAKVVIDEVFIINEVHSL